MTGLSRVVVAGILTAGVAVGIVVLALLVYRAGTSGPEVTELLALVMGAAIGSIATYLGTERKE